MMWGGSVVLLHLTLKMQMMPFSAFFPTVRLQMILGVVEECVLPDESARAVPAVASGKRI